MKKSLIKVICALILLTVLIASVQNIDNYSTVFNTSTNWTGAEKHVDNIVKKDEESLNEWLSLYNAEKFTKVEVEDSVTLKGYILSGSEETTSIFPLWWSKTVDNYRLVTTKKPADTSKSDWRHLD